MICSINPHSRWINITSLISCMENLRQEGYALTAVAEKSGCKHHFWHKGISLLPARCVPCSHPCCWAFQNWGMAQTFRKKNNKPKRNRHCAHRGHSGFHLQQKNMYGQLRMCIYVFSISWCALPACTHVNICGLRCARMSGHPRWEICCHLMPSEPQVEEYRTRPRCRTTQK